MKISKNQITTAYELVVDWLNVPLYTRGKLELRRIDVLLVLFGIFCTAWYGYTSGWRGALVGGMVYIMVVMIALWML